MFFHFAGPRVIGGVVDGVRADAPRCKCTRMIMKSPSATAPTKYKQKQNALKLSTAQGQLVRSIKVTGSILTGDLAASRLTPLLLLLPPPSDMRWKSGSGRS